MDIQTKDGILLRGIPDGTPDEVIKERINKIRAEGGQKTTPKSQGRSFSDEALRQVGLTARHGLEGVGGVADSLAYPIRYGLNKILPAKQTMSGLVTGDEPQPAITGNTGAYVANKLGLPSPENPTERVVGDVTQAMAGTGGLAGGAAALARQAPKAALPVLDFLSANQGTQALASAGAGAGGGIARESEVGPLGQMGASLAGGLAAPGVLGGARMVGDKLGDLGATIGASFGNKTAANRLATDAVTKVAGSKRDAIIAALRNPTEYVPGAKPTVAEAITEANMRSPEQFGGAIVKLQKDLSGARGIEDILPTVAKQQRRAVEDHLANIKTITGPMRASALEGANTGAWFGTPLNSQSIVANIDKTLSKPGIRSSDVVQKSLAAVKEKIENLPQANGAIDARDLYTVRKEIGNTIDRFAKETANWDKNLTSTLEREIQKQIDNAITSAGGSEWKNYLKTYSEGMKGAENQALRLAEVKKLAAGIKRSTAGEITAGEIPKPPTLLSRPMMFANYLLKMVSGGAEPHVAKRVAEAMKDPKEFAKLLAERPPPLGQRASEVAKRAALATALQEQR